ncbi:hypothetical protein ABZ897_24470 [Nonomuraea sp. NPDC046802]|uniref:hypothetical protein n=1 Tax=Nonomuraea sp. NPDC046802 TaxID=3154919 RepID=UPI0033FA89D1
MKPFPDLTTVRQDLHDLLQESDPRRPLDSLETVVVLSYLDKNQLDAGDEVADRPQTIEGWVAWVARHSPDS